MANTKQITDKNNTMKSRLSPKVWSISTYLGRSSVSLSELAQRKAKSKSEVAHRLVSQVSERD